jgi:AraC-like DNA-binding protein
MLSPILFLKLVVGGVSIGALIAVSLGVWRSAKGTPAAVALVLMSLGIVGHQIQEMAFYAGITGAWLAPFAFLSVAAAGFIWLFVGVVFEDIPISRANLAIPAAVSALGVLALVYGEMVVRDPFWLLYNLSVVLVAGHALWRIWRSRGDDLVEPRRRLRTPFMLTVAGYMLLLGFGEGVDTMGISLEHLTFLSSSSIAVLCVLGAAIFLRADMELFAPARPRKAPHPEPSTEATEPASQSGAAQNTGPSAADLLEIRRLLDHMTAQRPWADEAFGLEALGGALSIPAHRLRRLINVHLGFRNFAQFANSYRIEAARHALSDPEQARRTVSSIAFDLGFGSLGPFNRAFREATGQSPTAYRAEALESASPKPEDPR